MESETSGDSTRRSSACFRSALVYCQTQTLAPAVSIRRPPCPRGSVIPFDPVSTHPAAEVVPVASANIAITIHIQFRRIAVFVSRFQPALIGVYFGRLVRVTVHIPPYTTVPARYDRPCKRLRSCRASSPCECIFRQRKYAADKNEKE